MPSPLGADGCRTGVWTFFTSSLEETIHLGRRLGASLLGGEVLALVGDLGSGKTALTRGIAMGAGLLDHRLVSSPTYVLEQIYSARLEVHHYDVYRLSSPREFVALGFEEHLGKSAVLVVEWADKVLEVLPAERLVVEIAPGAMSLGARDDQGEPGLVVWDFGERGLGTGARRGGESGDGDSGERAFTFTGLADYWAPRLGAPHAFGPTPGIRADRP